MRNRIAYFLYDQPFLWRWNWVKHLYWEAQDREYQERLQVDWRPSRCKTCKGWKKYKQYRIDHVYCQRCSYYPSRKKLHWRRNSPIGLVKRMLRKCKRFMDTLQ